MDPDAADHAVRIQAFAWLEGQARLHDDAILPRRLLVRGFDFLGARVPLQGPPGIFKPAVLPSIPLSITTAPPGSRKPRPYDDRSDAGARTA